MNPVVQIVCLLLGLVEFVVRVGLLLVSFVFIIGVFIFEDNPKVLIPYLWERALS